MQDITQQLETDTPRDHTVKQAAVQLQATTQIVRKAIKKGLLKAYKISERNTRITQEAINEFRNNGGML